MTELISGFPGVGKSFFVWHYKGRLRLPTDPKINIMDSDSSRFSLDEDGALFPQNYIDYILDSADEFDIVMISTHDVVRDALVKQDIDFTLVYPNIDLKSEYMERYNQRGDNKSFIKLINTNWDKWITELQSQEGCKKIELSTGQYLSDVISDILIEL